jgi:L-ascorbate metabolism protein UlaG (beta-lactamase superfamily)
LAIAINPKVVIPMHWFEADPQEFKKEVEKRSDIEVKVLQTGEMYRL